MTDIYDALRAMPDDQVQEFRDYATQLLEQRRRVKESPERIDRMIEEYQQALGRAGGDPWVRPVTVMDSYPNGAVVDHGGLYASLVPMNMAEPGTDPTAWEPADGGDDAA